MNPPTLSTKRAILRSALVFVLAVVGSFATAPATLPDLAKLKLAAEAGDAKAQFEYGSRIAFSNPTESFAMILNSAKQGYAPAEASVGSQYFNRPVFDSKERARLNRLGVRYTSRAAFKGIASAQARISECYQYGTALPKNSVLAYAWMAIAARTAGPTGYKPHLDVLVAKTPSWACLEKVDTNSGGFDVV